MADWQFELELKDVWESEDPLLIAKAIVERGKNLAAEIRSRCENPKGVDILIKGDLERMAEMLEEDVIKKFEEFVEVDEGDVFEFDYIMSDLYDWADTALDNRFGGMKMCWVST